MPVWLGFEGLKILALSVLSVCVLFIALLSLLLLCRAFLLSTGPNLDFIPLEL